MNESLLGGTALAALRTEQLKYAKRSIKRLQDENRNLLLEISKLRYMLSTKGKTMNFVNLTGSPVTLLTYANEYVDPKTNLLTAKEIKVFKQLPATLPAAIAEIDEIVEGYLGGMKTLKKQFKGIQNLPEPKEDTIYILNPEELKAACRENRADCVALGKFLYKAITGEFLGAGALLLSEV